MICEIGNFLILLSMVLLPLQGICAFSNQFLLIRIKKVHCLLIASAYMLLVLGFVLQDQTILGVLIHSSPEHPLHYRIGATWSYHQGSMLLWSFLMSCVALVLPLRALGFFSFFQLYFLTLLYLKASPFIEVPQGEFLSRGINPLLEDSALLYHPLFLYMGYILIFATWSIVLSYLSKGPVVELKKWVFGSWIFLSLGLISGSFWAFYEVGWGGWWFWDPVENIALIPWLLLLGSLHLFKAQKPHSVFLYLLLFLSFLFAFLGVFTVRMGLLRSIHNFTQSFDNLNFVFAGAVLILASALLLLMRKRDKAPLELARAMPGLLGIIFASLIAVATFLPLFSGFEVGSLYYTSTVMPLSIIYPLSLAFLSVPQETLKKHKGRYILIGLLCGMFIVFLCMYEKQFLIPFTLVCMICVSMGLSIWMTQKRRILGSTISHAGFVVFVLGVCFNHFLYLEKEVNLAPQESTIFFGKSVSLAGIQIIQKPHYKAEIATIKWEGVTLYPERRYYKNYDMIRQKVDFSLGVFVTLYAYIIDRTQETDFQKWTLKFQYHPLISWIWLGGLLMVLGGIFSLYGYSRSKTVSQVKRDGS